jgi:hypothetical protein
MAFVHEQHESLVQNLVNEFTLQQREHLTSALLQGVTTEVLIQCLMQAGDTSRLIERTHQHHHLHYLEEKQDEAPSRWNDEYTYDHKHVAHTGATIEPDDRWSWDQRGRSSTPDPFDVWYDDYKSGSRSTGVELERVQAIDQVVLAGEVFDVLTAAAVLNSDIVNAILCFLFGGENRPLWRQPVSVGPLGWLPTLDNNVYSSRPPPPAAFNLQRRPGHSSVPLS